MNSKQQKISTLSKEQLKKLLQKRASKKGNEFRTFPKMPLNEQSKYPLSKAQERLWFLQELNHNNGLYNIAVQAFINFDSPLKLHLLNKSLNSIIASYHALRTTFHFDKKPYQKIHKNFEYAINFVDIQDLPKEKRIEKVEEIAIQEVNTSIEISKLPLFRLKIIRCEKLKYFFSFTPNHIITDGWSNATFIKELFGRYQQLLDEDKIETKEIPFQYIDYVRWEQEWLSSNNYKNTVQYWKQDFTPLPETLKLPLDRNRPANASGKGKMLIRDLEKSVSKKINEFCIENGFTPYHYFLGALNILLHRYSSQNKIVVGVPMANRTKMEFQSIFGLFLNTLPIKIEPKPEDCFIDILQKVKTKTAEVFPLQQMPFDKIISNLNIERNQQITPLFQVLFLFQNIPSLYSYNGISIEPYKLDIGLTKNDINIWVEETNNRFLISFYANTDIFSLEKIEAMADHFVHFLKQLMNLPKKRISEINYLTTSEKLLLQQKPSTTKKQSLFINNFRITAQKYPERLAVEFKDERLSYKELDIWTNNLAKHISLLNQNKKPVAILFSASLEIIPILLSILKSGVPYVAIDTRQPQARIKLILEDSGVEFAFCKTKLKQLCAETAVQLIDVHQKVDDKIKSTKLNDPKAEDLAYIIYTSGTSGSPKGVQISHGALANYVDAINKRVGFETNSRFASLTPLSTDLGNTMVFPALSIGSSLLIVPHQYLLNTNKLEDYFTEFPVDYMKMVPTHLATLLKTGFTAIAKKILILGGETFKPSLFRTIRNINKKVRIFNHYGPTETTIGVCTYEVLKINNNYIPIGKPLDGNRLYILDKNLQIVPIGVEGDLYIAGSQLAQGYHNHINLTKEKFVSLTLEKRLYATGDRARLNYDANFIFVGRKDQQIKIRGNRVEPGEIENVLMQISNILNAVVWYNNSLNAAIVSDKKVSENNIKTQLSLLLPSHMVPERVLTLQSIPLKLSGKTNFNKLNKLLINTAQHLNKKNDYKLNVAEQKITEIFSKVLQQNINDAHSSFFVMGGNSLLSVELLFLLNKTFKTKLPLSFLFKHQSITEIAKGLNSDNTEENIVKLHNTNKGKAIILIHAAGGNILSYTAIGDLLKNYFDVFAIQSQGELFESIEAMANYYLQKIAALNYQGEIILGGWSMGAIVAYETAIQWQLKTAKPKVFMIDQPANHDLSPKLNNDLDKIIYFAKKAEHLAGKRLNISKEILENKTASQRAEIFLEKFKMAGLVPKETLNTDFYKFLELMIQHNYISELYKPKIYNKHILLVRADNSMDFENEPIKKDPRPTDLFWKQYAPNIEIVSCPGNHVNIMRSPNIEVVAEKIKQLL
jgi:amino acid adenylation domain-containing protein